jgi:hypothetical protein
VARNGAAAAAAVVLAVVVSGCGSSQDDPAELAARDFYAAVRAGDGAAACELLAPQTRHELAQSSAKPCAVALLSEDLPTVGRPDDVRAYGTMAEVRYDTDTVFVTRFRYGWRVMAAACTPTPAGPYDCEIKGA